MAPSGALLKRNRIASAGRWQQDGIPTGKLARFSSTWRLMCRTLAALTQSVARSAEIFTDPMITMAAVDRLVLHAMIVELTGDTRRTPRKRQN